MDALHGTPGPFVPPFCPNPNCPYHNTLSAGWRFKRAGHFTRLITPATDRRDADNDRFEVNLMDLMIRHRQANHRREAIAASNRRHELKYAC